MVNFPAIPAGTPITFRGQYSEEVFQFYCRQHWIRIMPAFARMLLMTALVALAGAVLFATPATADPGSRRVVLVFLLLFFLITQFDFLEKFYNHFLYMIIVTDRRIHRIKKTLFLTNDRQSVDLWVLQDIDKVQHGLVQNLLGFGSLVIEAQETELRLHFIPDVSHKYEKLMHLREKARRKAVEMGQLPPAAAV